MRYCHHWYCLQHFSKHFVCSGHNCQIYQLKLSNEDKKQFCLFLKPKWYLDTKCLFSSVLATLAVSNGVFLFTKYSVYFRHLQVFAFYQRLCTKNRRTRTIFTTSRFEVLRLSTRFRKVLFRKLSADFQRFRIFIFCHRAYWFWFWWSQPFRWSWCFSTVKLLNVSIIVEFLCCYCLYEFVIVFITLNIL